MLGFAAVIVRYFLALGLFYISGTQMLTGVYGACCGVGGCAMLTSALLRFSPIAVLLSRSGSR